MGAVFSYRLYFVGRDGHFDKAVPLEQPDDDAAVAAAFQLSEGRPMELWRGARPVRFYEAAPQRQPRQLRRQGPR